MLNVSASSGSKATSVIERVVFCGMLVSRFR
jgi:hypothetical protein